jgi:succinate dehydrogenase / fumarate reductase, membrane anchor subunit
MVGIATSLGRNGVHDWIIQRVTAVILAIYAIFVLYFFVSTPDVSHAQLIQFFGQPVVKWLSISSLFAVCFHAWIGMWIISTDYIKPLAARMLFQVLVIITCLTFVGWGISILWGI